VVRHLMAEAPSFFVSSGILLIYTICFPYNRLRPRSCLYPPKLALV
jgi:hypothetical protein